MREFTFLLNAGVDEEATYRAEVSSLGRARELAKQLLARSDRAAASIDILEGDTRVCTVSGAGSEAEVSGVG